MRTNRTTFPSASRLTVGTLREESDPCVYSSLKREESDPWVFLS